MVWIGVSSRVPHASAGAHQSAVSLGSGGTGRGARSSRSLAGSRTAQHAWPPRPCPAPECGPVLAMAAPTAAAGSALIPGYQSPRAEIESEPGRDSASPAADHASLRPEIESRAQGLIEFENQQGGLPRIWFVELAYSFVMNHFWFFLASRVVLPVDRKQGERSRARPRVQDAGQSRKWAVRHRAYVGTMRQRPKKTDRDAPVGLLTRCFRAPFVARAAKSLVR